MDVREATLPARIQVLTYALAVGDRDSDGCFDLADTVVGGEVLAE